MCMAHERACECGARSASFHFRDNILPEQVVAALYCPECAPRADADRSATVTDNGWIIRFDMDVARATAGRNISPVTPETIFDQGFCTWNGMYPGDHIDSVRERGVITSLAKTDPAGYLKTLRSWAVKRSERLKQEGWRKAQDAA